MKFDVSKYVFANLERAKKGSTNQISAVCPFCEKYGSFYIDAESGNYICFKCGERGRHLVGIVAEVEGVTWQQARTFLLKNLLERRRKETLPSLIEKIRGLRETDDEDEEEKIQPLPDEFVPIYKHKKWRFPLYLKERGVERKTARVWGLGFCNRGRYRNRIIIPIVCPGGESFTSRDVTGHQQPKYLNPVCSFQSHLLLGWPQIQKGGDLVLVEGPLDVIKLSQNGFNALALGGKVLHPEQIRMLTTLPSDTTITVMLDPEEKKAPLEVAKQLVFVFEGVYISTLSTGTDPGSATKGQVEKAVDNAVVFRGERGASLDININSLRQKLKETYS